MATHESTPPSPVETQQGTVRDTHAIGRNAGMSWMIDIDQARWLRFLSRWALLTGLVNVCLWLVFGLWFVPASQGGSLPAEYGEFVAATRNPALYRIAITIDVAAWLVLGVFLLTLAIVLGHRAPLRSTFIAACAIGQVAGMSGAFIRLNGISDLAGRSVTTAPEQQVALLRSFLDLQLVLTPCSQPAGRCGPLHWCLRPP